MATLTSFSTKIMEFINHCRKNDEVKIKRFVTMIQEEAEDLNDCHKENTYYFESFEIQMKDAISKPEVVLKKINNTIQKDKGYFNNLKNKMEQKLRKIDPELLGDFIVCKGVADYMTLMENNLRTKLLNNFDIVLEDGKIKVCIDVHGEEYVCRISLDSAAEFRGNLKYR